MRKTRKRNRNSTKPRKSFFSFLRLKRAKGTRRAKEKITLKPSDLRKRKFLKKRNRLLSFSISLAILAFALIFALWYVTHAEGLTIQTIDVRNGGRTSAEEIEVFVKESLEEGGDRFFPRTNSFFVPIRELERSLADSFIRVERTNILRKGLDELIVVVEERSPAYIFCEDNDTLLNGRYIGECFFADVSGVIYSHAPYLPKSEFLIVYLPAPSEGEYFGNIPLTDEELAELTNLVEVLEREDIGVGRVRLVDEDTIEVGTDEPFSLLLEIDNDYTDELERFFSALDAEVFDEGQSLEDVYQFDLRFGSKIFYRYYE
jgi:hypothetical protein